MLKIMSTGMTALVVVIGGSSLGYAQSPSAEASSRGATVSDLNTLTDARIAIVKAALQLTPEQEKSWAAIEDAIRSRAKTGKAVCKAWSHALMREVSRAPSKSCVTATQSSF